MFDFMKSRKNGSAAIDDGISLTDVRFVVVDTELTGLDERKDSIVSIGAVRMTGGKIGLGDSFYRLVNPDRRLTAESIVIHEITPSEVEAKPGIGTALREFLEFCGDDVLMGHFLSIDLAFLNREMKKATGERLGHRVVDTCSLFEWLRRRRTDQKCILSAAGGFKLYDIVKCFGIPVEGAHNALQDAFATAQLFQRLLPFLLEAGVADLGDLLRIGAPFEGDDRIKVSGEICNF